jgi:hypothetical protein
MKRVTGIGGIFFKSESPPQLYDWYEKHLGIQREPHGQGASFHWRELQAADRTEPGPKALTAWCIFPQTTKYFGASKASFMVSYRVDNLDALLEDLKKSADSPGSPTQTATALSYGNQRKTDRSSGGPRYISGALNQVSRNRGKRRLKSMKKTVLTFGLISGAISSLLMVATLPFAHRIGFNKALIVGYTTIVLSFLLVFFGIRSYRDNVANGQITFKKAFAVGISITLISCIFYVVTWEILYFNFMHDFMDNYGADTIEKLKASGASPAAVQVQVEQLKKLKEQYENPLFNSLMTFIEPFPIGIAITLISAAVLRKKAQSRPAPSPLPAS